MNYLIPALILVALSFDFVNGMHDAANAIATVVSTRVLSPKSAIIMAAFANFIAFLIFGVAVATTIGKGIISPSAATPIVILSALVGAISWDIITWYYGMPVSSSHALIGGFMGAAIFASGTSVIIWAGILKVLAFIFISPLIGLAIGFALMALILNVVKKIPPSRINKYFSKVQIFSAFAYGLGHGGNDAQKTMGIIAVLLFSSGYLGPNFYVPLWVVLAAHAAIALGTLSGGWRIVKTMGHKITKLRPIHGFAAETAGSVVLFASTHFGIPVSTTHVISASIMGVGSTRRASAVKWGVARNMIWAWILTIPASALIGGSTYFIVKHILLNLLA